MIAEVIVDIKNKQLNKSFDYLIPSKFEGLIQIGMRVYVPFGRMKRIVPQDRAKRAQSA